MFSTIRNRLIVIALLVLGSVVSLVPRDVTIRERGPDGRMRDTTIKRVRSNAASTYWAASTSLWSWTRAAVPWPTAQEPSNARSR